MRLAIPIFIFFAAVVWSLYLALIKRDRNMAMEITRPTLFFGLVWGILYYLIFYTGSPKQIETGRMTMVKDMHTTNSKSEHSVFIVAGEKFLWKKGLCLKANEESTFLIPGAIFPQNIPIGEILQLSDTDTEIQWLSDPRKCSNPLPDFKITLKTGATLKINRNTEVLLAMDNDSIKRKKKFAIIEDGLESNPNPDNNKF